MRYIYLVIVCVFCVSCARLSAVRDDSSLERKLRQTIDKEISFYEKEQKQQFLDYVSEDYYLGYKEFREDIEDFLLANSSINLDCRIEKILTSGRHKSVEVNWNKTYVNRQGTAVNSSGSAVLFFDVSGDEPVLINLKGNNPFTQ